MGEERHLNETELSDRLRLSVRTLQRWRWKGKGPRYLKMGGRVAYRLIDITEWEERALKGPGDVNDDENEP
jgi:predicted DNA-binding transcriptional regulator AlpA